MKVRRRSYSLDTVSVESKDRAISVSTHHHKITLSAYSQNGKVQDAFHEFTFDQLHALICKLNPGIENIL